MEMLSFLLGRIARGRAFKQGKVLGGGRDGRTRIVHSWNDFRFLKLEFLFSRSSLLNIMNMTK